MKLIFTFFLVITSSLLHSQEEVPPLNLLGKLTFPESVSDLATYGGYLYVTGRDNLYLYDLTGGNPELITVIPVDHSEYSARLYRWQNLLIRFWYVSLENHGIRFYDLRQPDNPLQIWELIPPQAGITDMNALSGGFPSDNFVGCSVAKDYLFCPSYWAEGEPMDWYPDCCFVPYAIHLPDFEAAMLYTHYYELDGCRKKIKYSGGQIRYYRGEFFFPAEWSTSHFLKSDLDSAIESGSTYWSPCLTGFPYCTDSCLQRTSFQYKDYYMTNGSAWPDPDHIVVFYLKDRIYDYNLWDATFLVNYLGSVNTILAYESCAYVTKVTKVGGEEVFHLYNFDLSNLPLYAGVNELASRVTGAIASNNRLYVASGDEVLLFDAARHDDHFPTGSVEVTLEGNILHFHGQVLDDDEIQAVYVRFGNQFMAAKEFEEAEMPWPPPSPHQRPFDLPRRFDLYVDISLLAPGTYPVKTVAVDWEGSFTVIDEREIEIGSTKFERATVPMDGRKKLTK